MALPTYNKAKRRTNFEPLPKGAYVVKIVGAKEDTWPSGDRCLKIAFDVAEGAYKGIYANLFDARKRNNENAQWPVDGVFNLNIPSDGCDDKVWTNWNSFFADLEDSNSGFIFDGDIKKLKGKLIGGKFRIKQSRAKRPNENGEYPIFTNTQMLYSCVADDVRHGKAGKLPNDVLIKDSAPAATGGTFKNNADELDGFVNLPDGSAEELPF